MFHQKAQKDFHNAICVKQMEGLSIQPALESSASWKHLPGYIFKTHAGQICFFQCRGRAFTLNSPLSIPAAVFRISVSQLLVSTDHRLTGKLMALPPGLSVCELHQTSMASAPLETAHHSVNLSLYFLCTHKQDSEVRDLFNSPQQVLFTPQ